MNNSRVFQCPKCGILNAVNPNCCCCTPTVEIGGQQIPYLNQSSEEADRSARKFAEYMLDTLTKEYAFWRCELDLFTS